jgi:hypothetical protein
MSAIDMADGDEPPPEVIPFQPRPKPKQRSEEDLADTRWEIMARRDARLGRVEETPSRIPTRVRWWIAAAFIVALVIVLRDRIAEWLPWFA